MNSHKFNKLAVKRNFVAIFVSISVIGVILISIAVYNASIELEIIHEIDSLYQVTSDRINQDSAEPAVDMGKWARKWSTKEYQLFVMHRDRHLDLDLDSHSLKPYVTTASLEGSQINNRGGYIDDHGKIITWASIPYGELSVIAAHEFESSGINAFVYVYAKRLFLPTAFYLWMVVWGSLILGFLLDRLRSQKQAMEHMALHDSLTGLPNRHLFSDRLDKVLQRAKRDHKTFALAIIDMDKFKRINDAFGHEAGDSLLKQIAIRLSRTLRESDTAARMGGDEFTVLMPDIGEDGCMALCTRVIEALSGNYELDGRMVHVGCSIGAAFYPYHGRNSDDLLRAADHAMYSIKSRGGGVHVCRTAGDVHSVAELAISSRGA